MKPCTLPSLNWTEMELGPSSQTSSFMSAGTPGRLEGLPGPRILVTSSSVMPFLIFSMFSLVTLGPPHPGRERPRTRTARQRKRRLVDLADMVHLEGSIALHTARRQG